MRRKWILIATILIFALGTTTALAATEWVYTLLKFTIVSSQEITVTLRALSPVASGPSGTQTANNIIFNTTTGSQNLTNATVEGGAVQDGTYPIISIANSGTQTVSQVNISINETLAGVSTACPMGLAYSNASYSVPGIALTPATGNVTLVQNLDYTEPALSIWLFGNFSNCIDADDDQTYFHVWAYWP